MYACLRGESPSVTVMSSGQWKRFLGDAGLPCAFSFSSTLPSPARAGAGASASTSVLLMDGDDVFDMSLLEDVAERNPTARSPRRPSSTARTPGSVIKPPKPGAALTAAVADVVYSKHTEVRGGTFSALPA